MILALYWPDFNWKKIEKSSKITTNKDESTPHTLAYLGTSYSIIPMFPLVSPYCPAYIYFFNFKQSF